MREQTTRGTPVLDISTKLAYARTRAAYERTMMSWIRTATSLITFGFSVYKFFQFEKPTNGSENRLVGPREFALTLVSIGLFSLVLQSLLQFSVHVFHWPGIWWPRRRSRHRRCSIGTTTIQIMTAADPATPLKDVTVALPRDALTAAMAAAAARPSVR